MSDIRILTVEDAFRCRARRRDGDPVDFGVSTVPRPAGRAVPHFGSPGEHAGFTWTTDRAS